MSRIRSIHPGLWTDEAFVTLSPMARLFLMGLWNECDDMGSFAWSPLGLKMRILPADNADGAALLAEIEAAGVVLKYEVSGKAYGAVRNFCQYQRPKKPNSSHPQTDEVRKWVNLDARTVRDGGEPVGNQFDTPPENDRQMEDGGGVKEACSDEQADAQERPNLLKGVGLPDWLPPEPWMAFVRSRKAIPKVPFTEDAAKGAVRKCNKLRGEGYDPAKLLWKAVDQGWRTVFPNDECKATITSGPVNYAERAKFYESIGQHDKADECRRKAVSVGSVANDLLRRVG